MQRPATERGDTLIEVLIALVIISLSVVALLGALATSATGSAEHKSVSALDTLLRNFAEAAKYDVQLAPTSTAQYVNCATSYLVGTEFPQSGQAGQTTVSVFGSGFPSGDSVTATIGGATLGTAPVNSGMSSIGASQSADGFVVVSGKVPAVGVGAQQVLLTDTTSGKSVTTPTPFNVSSSSSSSGQLSGYKIGIGDPNTWDSMAQQAGIAYWNSSTQQFVAFTDPSVAGCSATANSPFNSGIQMLTFTAKSDNGVQDHTSIVVTNPGDNPPLPAPSVAVSSTPPSPSVGNTVTFTATLTGSTGGSAPSCPTGTQKCVTWVFSGVSSSPTCSGGSNQTSLMPSGNQSSTSCQIVNASAGLQVTAQYSGDTNYSSTSGYWSGQVAKASPTVSVAAPSTDPRGTTIATSAVSATLASGYSPTGTITFTVFGPQNSAPTSCSSGGTTVGTANVTANGTYHPSAGFTPSAAGAYWWYASYSGDSNNLAAPSTCGSTMAMTFVGATVSQSGSNKGSSGSATVNLGANPAMGSQLVILVYAVPNSASALGSPVIGGSAVATPLTGPVTSVSPGNNNQGQAYELWAYVETATGVGKQVTVTVAHASTVELDVLALTGNAANPVAHTNTGTSNSPAATLTTAPQAGDLEIAFIGTSANDGGVGAPPSNWTAVENANGSGYGVASYYTNLGAATSTTFATTSSVHWATIALDVASS